MGSSPLLGCRSCFTIILCGFRYVFAVSEFRDFAKMFVLKKVIVRHFALIMRSSWEIHVVKGH